MAGRWVGRDLFVARLTGAPRHLVIASRAAAPDVLGTARDPRRLGVVVRRAVLAQGRSSRLLEAADSALTEGLHGFEPAERFGWTDGQGRLPPVLWAGVSGSFSVDLHIAARARYPHAMGG